MCFNAVCCKHTSPACARVSIPAEEMYLPHMAICPTSLCTEGNAAYMIVAECGRTLYPQMNGLVKDSAFSGQV